MQGPHRMPIELRLDLVQHRLGVHLDVALFVIALAGDEQQVPVGNRAAEHRVLGLRASSIVHLLHRTGLLALRHSRARGSGDSGIQKPSSAVLVHTTFTSFPEKIV